MCIFLTISFIFSIPLQLFHILPKKALPLPIDYAVISISISFSIVEFFLSIYTIYAISERKTALFILRNSQTMYVNKPERIKSNDEIQEELFSKFPELRKKYGNKNNNSNDLPAISKKRN